MALLQLFLSKANDMCQPCPEVVQGMGGFDYCEQGDVC